MTTAISRSIPPQRLINFVNPVVRAVLQSPLHGAVDNALLLLHIIAARPPTTTTSPWDTEIRTLRLPQKIVLPGIANRRPDHPVEARCTGERTNCGSGLPIRSASRRAAARLWPLPVRWDSPIRLS